MSAATEQKELVTSLAESELHENWLDGIRGVAVLMVLSHHALANVPASFAYPPVKKAIEYGWTGVSLFFIVSAFTLLRSWESRRGTESSPALRFYVRRAFRILPFWWFNVAIDCIHWQPAFVPLLANVTLVFGFFAKGLGWTVVAYGWSLCVEETFYWLMPLWAKWLNSLKRVVVAFFCAAFLSMLWSRYAPQYFGHVENHEFFFGFPLSRYYEFFLGFLAYRLCLRPDFRDLVNRMTEGRIPWLDFCYLALGSQVLHHGMIFVSVTIWVLFLAARSPRTLIGRVVRMKWTGKIGIVCYSMYFLHWHVLRALSAISGWLFDFLHVPAVGEMQALVMIVLGAILTFAISVPSYLLIERPSVMLGRRFLASNFAFRRFALAAKAR